jgi:hypothetical protein
MSKERPIVPGNANFFGIKRKMFIVYVPGRRQRRPVLELALLDLAEQQEEQRFARVLNS